MAYDEEFAARVRSAVQVIAAGPVEEKRMFGGLALLLAGNMAVVVRGKGGGLMVRVDPAQADEFAGEPGAAVTDMNGRAMRGWITVEAGTLTKETDLRRWVKRGVTFTRTLAPK